MTRKLQRIWAIGEKGWVELRSHPTPPKQHVSESSKWVDEEVVARDARYNPAEGRYEGPVWKKVKRQLRLVLTIYIGGRVLGIIALSKFRRLLKISVNKGGMTELSVEQYHLVKSKLEASRE